MATPIVPMRLFLTALALAIATQPVMFTFPAAAAPPYGEVQNTTGRYTVFQDCSTRNELVISLQMRIPAEYLEEYKKRRSRSIPNDKFFDHVERMARWRAKHHSVAFPFDQKFQCRSIKNGHHLSSKQVCELLANEKGYDLVRLRGANYCGFPGGNAFAAIPWLACERYAEKKLKLNLDQIATFARWDGTTHRAVCFYFDNLDIERFFSRQISKLKKRVHKEMWKHEKTYALFSYNKKGLGRREMFAEILRDKETRANITVQGYPTLYGDSLLALAKSDLEFAIKIAERTWPLKNPNYQYYSIDHKGYVRTGSKSNLKQVSTLLEEIRQDRKSHRKALEQSFNRYFHERNAVEKQKLHDSYLDQTKVQKALKDLEAATTQLHTEILDAYNKEQ